MGRIKQGLDYFPLNTDFMHDRIVRRVMKQEGDAAFTIILYTLSHIYSGEGYYVRADRDFFDELSDQLFCTDNDHVRRTLLLAVKYGLFDADLYERYNILTSTDIQRQFLFIAKRRSRRHLLADYCLIPEEETQEKDKAPEDKKHETAPQSPEDTVAKTGDIVAETPDTVTESRDTAYNIDLHKKKEKKRIENILPNPPSGEGGDEVGEGGDFSNGKPSAPRRCELTQQDVDRMQAPNDGRPRNLEGLLDNLRLYRIAPSEQYAIVRKSNYGEIGGKVWQGLSSLRTAGGKIKLPGHYLLSLLQKRE